MQKLNEDLLQHNVNGLSEAVLRQAVAHMFVDSRDRGRHSTWTAEIVDSILEERQVRGPFVSDDNAR